MDPNQNNPVFQNESNVIPIKASRHYVWFLIAVICLGVLGWVTLYFSETLKIDENENALISQIDNDPFSGWKTYKDDIGGFEIKYPIEWSISKASDNSPVFIQSTSFENNLPGLGIPSVGNVWIDILGSCNGETSDFVGQSKLDILEKTVCLGDSQITLGLWQSDPNLDKNKKILNQILSTFKFTNATSSDISTWKTYRNNQYGFDLDYPNGWIIDNTYSDNDFTKRGGEKYLMGGDTHWANYRLVSDGPIETPADYRSLYLIVYRKGNEVKTIDDYFGLKNYPNDYSKLLEVRDFIGKSGEVGRQYVTENLDHPIGVQRIVTIFMKRTDFYVFHSEIQSREIHNQILSTFKFTN